MSKIETFKNERLEFDLFAGAMIFIAFKRKFGKSLQDHFANNQDDMEALAFIVYEAYKSACYIKKTDPKYTEDDLLNCMDLIELLQCFNLLFPVDSDAKKKK